MSCISRGISPPNSVTTMRRIDAVCGFRMIETDGADDVFDIRDFCLRKRFGRGVALPQRWRYFIHAFVGGLRRQQHGDGELERVAPVVQRAFGGGVVLVHALGNFQRAFLFVLHQFARHGRSFPYALASIPLRSARHLSILACRFASFCSGCFAVSGFQYIEASSNSSTLLAFSLRIYPHYHSAIPCGVVSHCCMDVVVRITSSSTSNCSCRMAIYSCTLRFLNFLKWPLLLFTAIHCWRNLFLNESDSYA